MNQHSDATRASVITIHIGAYAMSAKRRGPAVARRQLRMKLRRARNDAAKTQNEIAEALDWSPSKILRIEGGLTSVTVSDLLALLTQYPNLTAERDDLLDLAREAKKTVAGRYSDVIKGPFRTWLDYEAYADLIQQYEPAIVPGVLQTDDYASGVVHALVRDTEEADRIVEARLERSEPLIGSEGPVMEFIVDEAVLRRGVGNESGTVGYAAMIDQLNHLKHMNTRGRKARNEIVEPELNPNISLQIVPFEMGAYLGMQGPFELIEFEGEEDSNMMYFEDPEGDQVIRDNYEQIEKYLELFSRLKKKLPSPAETNEQIDLIIQLMTERQNGIPALSRKG